MLCIVQISAYVLPKQTYSQYSLGWSILHTSSPKFNGMGVKVIRVITWVLRLSCPLQTYTEISHSVIRGHLLKEGWVLGQRLPFILLPWALNMLEVALSAIVQMRDDKLSYIRSDTMEGIIQA